MLNKILRLNYSHIKFTTYTLSYRNCIAIQTHTHTACCCVSTLILECPFSISIVFLLHTFIFCVYLFVHLFNISRRIIRIDNSSKILLWKIHSSFAFDIWFSIHVCKLCEFRQIVSLAELMDISNTKTQLQKKNHQSNNFFLSFNEQYLSHIFYQ